MHQRGTGRIGVQGGCLGRGSQNRQRQRCTRQCRHFAGNAGHRQAIRTIGGDRQLKNGVVETEHGSGGSSGRREGLHQIVQNSNPVHLGGLTQLRQGTNHALTGHTAQLPRLDREPNRGQNRPDHGDRNMDASTNIAGAANNLKWGFSTHINLANAQFVGIGVFLALEHMADHHALGKQAQVFNLFNLEAGHRKPFTKLFGWLLNPDEILKPGEGDPHEDDKLSWRSYEGRSQRW